MSHDHLEAFLHALRERDTHALMRHVTEDVALWSPILPEPFRGKAKVRSVLGIILDVVDRFEAIAVMRGALQSAVAFRLEAGDAVFDGVDLFTFDADGLIASIKIMWRPLPAIVAMQNRIAPHFKAPAMKLVPIAPAAA